MHITRSTHITGSTRRAELGGLPDRDRGAVLPLVLIFMTVFALIIISLAGLTITNLRANTTTRHHVRDLYARDAALEYGVHRIVTEIAADSSLCGDSGSPSADLGEIDLNDTMVHVTCDVVDDGSSGSGSGRPFVYLTGSSPDSKSDGYFYFDETEGGTVRVDADVYNLGKFYIKEDAGSIVDFGRSIEQRSADCQQSSPPSRLVHSGAPWDCPTTVSPPPMDPMPTMWAPSTSAPGRRDAGSCRYYYPGRHSDAPEFSSSKVSYFASGVYLFTDDVGTFDITGVAIGGEPGDEDAQSPRPACATDAQAWARRGKLDPDPNDSGVVFIFTGDAAMKLPSAAGNRVELFTYDPSPTTAPGPAALAGYSIIAPPTSGPNWDAHSKPTLIETDSMEPSLLSIHGLVFAPQNHLKLRLLTNESALTPESYMFGAGLVIASVELITSGLPPGEEIHFAGGPGDTSPATIVVEAVSSISGRSSVATLRYDPGDPVPLTVISWRATDD